MDVPSAASASAPRAAHERFVTSSRPEPQGMRSLVADSWRRCEASDVRPDGSCSPPLRWAPVELDAYRRAHPLAAVLPLGDAARSASTCCRALSAAPSPMDALTPRPTSPAQGRIAAGTMRPAQVLVLGAVVSAYDVRPASRGEVESLGARFLDVQSPPNEEPNPEVKRHEQPRPPHRDHRVRAERAGRHRGHQQGPRDLHTPLMSDSTRCTAPLSSAPC